MDFAGWSMARLRSRRDRRGANAVEFALVAPFLMALLLGTVDYGWFFLNQWFVMNAIQDAVRLGAMQSPGDTEGAGSCAACVSTTASQAVVLLGNHGITVSSATVTPTIVSINGACALALDPDIDHQALVGFVPLPDHYTIDAVWLLQNVDGC